MKNLFLLVSILISINSFSQVKKGTLKEEVFTTVEEMPEFKGGSVEMNKYFSKSLIYSPMVKKDSLRGKCYLSAVIDTMGNVTKTKLIKGVPRCPDCDVEVLRVVNAMPKWKPGKQKNKLVNVIKFFPVDFNMK